jgi:hypothetical protein
VDNVQEDDWHAANTKRLRVASQKMDSDDFRTRISIFNYAGTPLEQFSQLLSVIDIGSAKGDETVSAAVLSLTAPDGPAQGAQRKLAMMLDHNSPLLLFLRARVSTWREARDAEAWWSKWALEAHTTTMTFAAELYARVEWACSTYPLKVFSVSEASLPEFLGCPDCCLDQHGSRRMKAWCRTASQGGRAALCFTVASLHFRPACSLASQGFLGAEKTAARSRSPLMMGGKGGIERGQRALGSGGREANGGGAAVRAIPERQPR